MVVLRVIAGILFCAWLALIAFGKGGFVHLLLLNAIGVAAVDVMTIYRTRLTA